LKDRLANDLHYQTEDKYQILAQTVSISQIGKSDGNDHTILNNLP